MRLLLIKNISYMADYGIAYYILIITIFCILMCISTIVQWTSQIHKEYKLTWKESFKKAIECFFWIDNESH